MPTPAECCGGWRDLSQHKAPMGRVLLFRDARGSEWLGQSQTTGPDGEKAIAWAHIR